MWTRVLSPTNLSGVVAAVCIVRLVCGHRGLYVFTSIWDWIDSSAAVLPRVVDGRCGGIVDGGCGGSSALPLLFTYAVFTFLVIQYIVLGVLRVV